MGGGESQRGPGLGLGIVAAARPPHQCGGVHGSYDPGCGDAHVTQAWSP